MSHVSTLAQTAAAPLIAPLAAGRCMGPCGHNTSLVSNYDGSRAPLGVLHVGNGDGNYKFNKHCLRIKKNSLATPSCGDKLNLGVVKGEFVGYRNHSVVCRGLQLEGATFNIERQKNADVLEPRGPRGTVKPTAECAKGGEDWEVTIEKAAMVSKFALRPPNDEEAFDSYNFVPAYELRAKGAAPGSSNSAKHAVCNDVATWSLTLKEPPHVRDVARQCLADRVSSWDASGHLAVLAKGEIYDEDNVRVDAWGNPGQGWLHLACNGSAVSKMVLLGKGPEELVAPNGHEVRSSTLKMLTATYCDGFHGTEPGTKLHWADSGGTTFLGLRSVSETVMEAKWDQHGAVCLDSLRIFTKNPVPPINKWPDLPSPPFGTPMPTNQPDALAKIRAACPRLDKRCADVTGAASIHWTTRSVKGP